jgi:hypothetical protein
MTVRLEHSRLEYCLHVLLHLRCLTQGLLFFVDASARKIPRVCAVNQSGVSVFALDLCSSRGIAVRRG